MSLPVTLGLAALSAALAFACGWMGARHPDPHRGPRLVPYRFLMLVFAALCLAMLVHLANLAGIATGR